MDLKKIIKRNEILSSSRVVALCEYLGNLIAVPCDNAMSGYYPIYKKAIVITENVDSPPGKIEALLFKNNWLNECETIFAVDSWDGFQPATKEVDEYIDFIKWISKYI